MAKRIIVPKKPRIEIPPSPPGDPDPPPEPNEEFLLFNNFEDEVLRDDEWLIAQPIGTQAAIIRPRQGCVNSLDPTGGPEGQPCLKVTRSATGASGHTLLATWFLMYRNNNGTIGGINKTNQDETGYLIPGGFHANRFAFKVRFQEGYRANRAANTTANSGEINHIGTHCRDPALSGFDHESNNYHFYHRLIPRHDLAGDDWIQVIVNDRPNHQRGLSGVHPAWNPTAFHGEYFDTMKVIYFEGMQPYSDNPELEYPFSMWIHDIKFYYEPPTQDVTLALTGFANGEYKEDVPPSTNQDFELVINNNSGSPIPGRMIIQTNSTFNMTLRTADGSTQLATVSSPWSTTLETGTTTCTVRININPTTTGLYPVSVLWEPTAQLTDARRTHHTEPLLETRVGGSSLPHLAPNDANNMTGTHLYVRKAPA